MESNEGATGIVRFPADHRIGARLSGGIHVTGTLRWRYQERAAPIGHNDARICLTTGWLAKSCACTSRQYAVNWSWVTIGPTSDEYVYL